LEAELILEIINFGVFQTFKLYLLKAKEYFNHSSRLLALSVCDVTRGRTLAT